MSEARRVPESTAPAEIWSAGGEGQDHISRQIASAIEHAVVRLDPRPGERVLDLGTATGWGSRRLAESGARVTGADFAQDLIRVAKEIGPATIDYVVADAEEMPFEDGAFDGVMSTFAVMFCANPERAAAELARVTRPGGRVVIANWEPQGTVLDMFALFRRHHPDPPDAPSPFAWGDPDRVRELLGGEFDLGFEHAVTYYADRDGAAAWERFSTGFGPAVDLLRLLDTAAAAALRDDFIQLYEGYRTDVGILCPREYVIVAGTRKG